MRIRYREWKPKGEARAVIAQANQICADYRAQGYDLTLRQLYYQFVARGLIENNQQSYSRLGSIVNKARLAGLLDWDYIVDRTRNLEELPHWATPADVIRAAARSYALDKWADQPTRVEVWVEKEALAGVIAQVADRHDVAWFACRGYVSQSELWAAGQRLGRYVERGQNVVVLHLGDHDPSGIDMTRDITDRLREFTQQDWLNAHGDHFEGSSVRVSEIWRDMAARCNEHEHRDVDVYDPIEVRRIALNFDQVQEYDPPPNPAKLTDSRAAGYIDVHGDESWELDALDPATLDALIEDEIEQLRVDALWHEISEQEDDEREGLQLAAREWSSVMEHLRSEGGDDA